MVRRRLSHATPTLALIALLGSLLSACGGSAGASASPPTAASPSATPIPTGGRITSDRHGWSIEVPAGWRHRPSTEDWPPDEYPGPGAAYTDNFEPEGGWPAVDISTRLLAADETLDGFLAGLDAYTADLGCTVDEEDVITVDGVDGRFQAQSCAGDLETVYEVVLVDADRVHLIYFVGLKADAAEDEPLFHGIIDSFRLPAG